MSKGASRAGYTIVEVMIFLAVSSVMLVAALLLVNGQQNKTEFSQAVRDLESRLQDISNDIATGFYSRAGDMRCSYSTPGNPSSGVHLTPAAGVEQGANSDCIFIGRVIQFAPDDKRSKLRIYDVVGGRQNAAKQEVDSIQSALPVAIFPGPPPNGSAPDFSQEVELGGILRIEEVKYTADSGGPTFDTAGIGFFSTFKQTSGGLLASGSTTTDLVGIHGLAGFAHTPSVFVGNLQNRLSDPALPVIGSGQVTICLVSEATSQYALVTIEGRDRQVKTSSQIKQVTGPLCT